MHRRQYRCEGRRYWKKQKSSELQLDTGYGRCVDAIDFDPDTFVNNIKQWFGEDECVKMLNGQPNAVVIDVAYYPTINEYMGRRSLQMKMEAYNKEYKLTLMRILLSTFVIYIIQEDVR